jgi:hypothetical protein
MKTKLRAIEHRAVSGIWLLGGDFEEIIISEETYNWLWRNIYNICDNSRLVKMFWANSNQYFSQQLQPISPEHSFDQESHFIKNKAQIDKRNEERKRFLEFHYALGGLMLYRKQYKTLNYFFEYTQSQPPEYILLPETMTEIFYWLESFRNEFKHNKPLDLKYYFPELDNLGNSRQVNYWICCYISTLFIRQYSLNQFYIYQNFTELPKLPSDIFELSSWLDSISFFEKCLSSTLDNDQLIKDLDFEKVVEKNKDQFFSFIKSLKTAIKNKIGYEKLSAQLSEEKIDSYYSRSNEIISKDFETYKPIFIEKDEEHINSDLKININGERTLMSKSAFVDNDVPHFNYDTIFASSISLNKIKRLIPNAFAIARSKRYLLNNENLLPALSKIISNKTDIVIVAVHLAHQTIETLENSYLKDFIIHIPSSEYTLIDTLFILPKSSLPAIEHKRLDEDEMIKYKLKCINKDYEIYASVIDLNTDENKALKDEWNLENEPENEDFKVQLSIAFRSTIHWKNKRQVIQINIASEMREQGIQTSLNDLEPI